MLARARTLVGLGVHHHGPAETTAEPHHVPAPVALYSAIMDVLDIACRLVLLTLFIGELGLILVEIGRREIVGQSFLWSEEVSRLILLTLAFVGGPLEGGGR